MQSVQNRIYRVVRSIVGTMRSYGRPASSLRRLTSSTASLVQSKVVNAPVKADANLSECALAQSIEGIFVRGSGLPFRNVYTTKRNRRHLLSGDN